MSLLYRPREVHGLVGHRMALRKGVTSWCACRALLAFVFFSAVDGENVCTVNLRGLDSSLSHASISCAGGGSVPITGAPALEQFLPFQGHLHGRLVFCTGKLLKAGIQFEPVLCSYPRRHLHVLQSLSGFPTFLKRAAGRWDGASLSKLSTEQLPTSNSWLRTT
jgi:hypothetical protein